MKKARVKASSEVKMIQSKQALMVAISNIPHTKTIHPVLSLAFKTLYQ
jgi:hypothetical protein